MDLKETVKALPASSGVYIMKDAAGAVLYVGKAANVRKRVASYFYPNRRLPERTLAMIGKIDRIECVQTSTEAEALIYENSLIKQLGPKYNVLLRDDKSYPRLKLTVNEKFPRLLLTRRKLDDGALYFGPYASGKLLKEALVALRHLFPLRTCATMPRSGRPCLNYHIRQCRAPCAGSIDEARYAQIVAELTAFLEKGRSGLIALLTEKMLAASKDERFEDASEIRQRIEALGSMREASVRYIPADELEELKGMLGLQGPVETIEAFDVSNIMGQEAVGSMITFRKGRPYKSGYRKFKIRSVEGVDDYAMMREIVARRYARLLEEKGKMPDLILIDGGKGHLTSAVDELRKLGIAGQAIIGIAKEFEHVYLPGKPDPVILPRDSKALHLLERVRDEAHRFAITYHKKLRSKRIGESSLDGIPLIGPKRKKALLAHFGSLDGVRRASLEELLKVERMDERSAQSVIAHLRQ